MTLAAQHDVAVQPLAPQIEEAVAQPHLLAVVGVGCRPATAARSAGDSTAKSSIAHLDLAGRERRVDGLGRARAPPRR